MRIQVFRLDDRNHQIIWSHHHILMDGWCIGIVYEELMQIYQALINNEQPKLESPADYRDYLNWLSGYETEAALDFWKKELEGIESLTGLPRLESAEAEAELHRKTDFRIAGKSWNRLKKIAEDSGATTATLLQTLWGILLAKYSGKKDLIFGGIVSGRPEEVEDVEQMVGLFINAIPVRLRFSEEAKLADLLRKFQEEALERRPFEYLNLADIQQQSEERRELFDHLVVLENYPMEEELRGGENGFSENEDRPRIYQIEGFERTHFDFTLVAFPDREDLKVELTFNEAVYGSDQISRVQAHFLNLIEVLSENPELLCLLAEWLSADDIDLREQWNE